MPMLKAIRILGRRLLLKSFPKFASSLLAARARAHSQRMVHEWGCTEFNRKLMAKYGSRVLHGPFQGMLLTRETTREHIAPHLLGVYESELWGAWEAVGEMKFAQVVDVGAKFGYYAIGLARLFPGVPLVAFDIDPWARKATREMTEANDVSVKIEGACTPRWLEANLRESAFIISDCEGYEAALFGLANSSAFASATMLIEIHEQFSPGVGDILRKKFSETHNLTVIPAVSPNAISLPELDAMELPDRTMAVAEYRTAEQAWLFFLPKHRR